MNYLAHAYLSGPRPDVLAGNIVADFIRGKQHIHYPAGIQAGVLLHRFIDTETDNHPATVACRDILRPKFGKYGPVVLDILYDHLLAKHWQQYHPQPLDAYAKMVYATLNQLLPLLPIQSRKTIYYMVRYNWLASYANPKLAELALWGMSRRARFNNNMQHGIKFLYANGHNTFFAQAFNKVLNHINQQAPTYWLV